MMTTQTEHVMPDESDSYIPQQLEEAYLDCLLGCDECDEKENNEQLDVTENKIEVMSGQTCPAEVLEEREQDMEVAQPEVPRRVSMQELSSSAAPFVCQLIRVAGITFAMPLAGFNRIIDVPDTIAVNENTASFCYGKIDWQGENVFVLALNRMMLATAGVRADSKEPVPAKIVLLEDKGCAFFCEEVLETVTVMPEKVNWRDSEGSRLWLAGMEKESGYAILDVTGIVTSLKPPD